MSEDDRETLPPEANFPLNGNIYVTLSDLRAVIVAAFAAETSELTGMVRKLVDQRAKDHEGGRQLHAKLDTLQRELSEHTAREDARFLAIETRLRKLEQKHGAF